MSQPESSKCSPAGQEETAFAREKRDEDVLLKRPKAAEPAFAG